MTRVHFWGIRGSIPSSSQKTIGYGCNTPCVSVEGLKNTSLILDAGTGIYPLGKTLVGENKNIVILMSHFHWDHIQGLPFFMPFYEKGRSIFIFSPDKTQMKLIFKDQMDGKRFPILFSDLASPPQFFSLNDPSLKDLLENKIQLKTIQNQHSCLANGIRLQIENKSLLYCTDNELDAPPHNTKRYQEFVEFCHGASILIHDCQYLDNETQVKKGWGHSFFSDVLTLGKKSQAETLVLFHHDPDRSDTELDRLQTECHNWTRNNGFPNRCVVAKEGMALSLTWQ